MRPAREKLTLGTLAHLLSQPVPGYAELPEFPTVPTDPNLRNPAADAVWCRHCSSEMVHLLQMCSSLIMRVRVTGVV